MSAEQSVHSDSSAGSSFHPPGLGISLTSPDNFDVTHNPYMPAYLSAAFNSFHESPPPFCVGSLALTSPDLHVQTAEGPYPLSLPLQITDIQLLTSLAGVGPTASALLNADQFACLKPDWAFALNSVVEQAMSRMHIPPHLVRAELAHLWLQQDAPVTSSGDDHHISTNFATLVLQLPCAFEGGHLTLYNRGEQTVFPAGAGRESEFASHYVTFLPGIGIEWSAPTRGSRLALIYHMIWLGSGMAPTCFWTNMDGLVQTLASYVNQEKDATAAWKLAFGLMEDYAGKSVANLILRGVDVWRVTALRHAAEKAGYGQLEVVVCRVVWNGALSDEHWKRSVTVIEALGVDGRNWECGLGFVNWGNVVQEGTLIDDLQEDGIGKQAAFAVALWPKTKSLELLYTPDADLDWMLTGFHTAAQEEKIGRVLKCIQLAGPRRNSAWPQTKAVLRVCAEHGMVSLAYRALQFSSLIEETPGMDQVLLKLVRTIGEASLACIVGNYLCPMPSRLPKVIVYRLEAAWALKSVIPVGSMRHCTAAIGKFVEDRRSIRQATVDTTFTNFVYSKNLDEYWFKFVSLLVHMESHFPSRDKYNPRAWGKRMSKILHCMNAIECGAMYRAFLSVGSLGGMEALFKALQQYYAAIDYPRFFKHVNIVVEFKAPKYVPSPLFDEPGSGWLPFLKIVTRAMSGTPPCMGRSAKFDKFLGVIAELSSREVRLMAQDACRLFDAQKLKSASETVPQATLDGEQKTLGSIAVEAIDRLRALAEDEPPVVQKTYPNFRCGDKDVETFMRSEELELTIAVEHMEKGTMLLNRIGPLFPEGTKLKFENCEKDMKLCITKAAVEQEIALTEYTESVQTLERLESTVTGLEEVYGQVETWEFVETDEESSEDEAGERVRKRVKMWVSDDGENVAMV